MAEEKKISAGKHLGIALREEGVEYYFGVTGGHIFALQAGIGTQGVKMIHCRHEQAGGYAADAYARASGKIGVCFGTAGPGMTNQVSAVAQAYFCKSPMVAIYGQHYSAQDGRGALQEAFAEQTIRPYTKWVKRVINPKLYACLIKKACRDALTYPQGPVALEFPADFSQARTTTAEQESYAPGAYTYADVPPSCGEPAAVEKAVRALLDAQKPVIAGGEDVRFSNAGNELREFAELTNIPVITRRTARGAVPEDHPLAFSGRVRSPILRASDVACVISLGMNVLEGFGGWTKGRKLVWITQSPSDIESTAPSAAVVIGTPKAVLRQMVDCAKDILKGNKPKREAWLQQVNDMKAKDKQRLIEDAEGNKNNKPIHPAWMAQECLSVLDNNATIILDGYTISHFVTERFLAKHAAAVLDSGTFAGVGHGVGMGIGAQLANPGKQVMVFMGDGGMGLGGMDVETAVRSHTPVVYALNDNRAWMAAWGRLHVKAQPVVGEQDSYTPWFMVPTRYDQVFAAMGAYTERVEDPSQIRAACERAFNSGKAAVLDIVCDRTTAPTAGESRGSLAEQARKRYTFFDPEDLPEDIRREAYPEEKK
jgi:acetolactate synthase-1/2/3 large subunit